LVVWDSHQRCLFAARGRQMDDTFGKNWVSFMNEAEHKMVCW
jgi:hypothetical protein